MVLERARRRIVVGTASVGAVAAGASAYLYLANPYNPGPPLFVCPFAMLTGLDCPGCGGQRMAYDLMHFDLLSAAHNNLFLLLVLPVLLVASVRALLLRWNGRRLHVPTVWIVALPVAAVAWAVVRNLPGWPLVPQ